MSTTGAPSEPVVLTAAGAEWLRDRLSRMDQRLARITAELDNERSPDLITERASLHDQAEELRQLLDQSVPPSAVRDDPEIVELGDEVEVRFPDDSTETFLVVHPAEAGLDEHRTSSDAPLARAVLGNRPGDRVTVLSPAGVYHAEILSRARID